MTPVPERTRLHEVELMISNLLRFGVAASLALVVVGTLLSFLHHPSYVASAEDLRRLTQPGTTFPHRLPEVWRGIRELRGQGVIALGLLLLIATPVLRVALSIWAFHHQGDRKFVVITSVVLVLLLASFLLGKAGG